MSTQTRAARGSVQIRSVNGRLSLIWTWGGKRFHLSLGMEDNSLTRKAAQAKATTIERDILLEAFDPTLAKYRSRGMPERHTTAVNLYDRFLEWKRSRVSASTLRKYLTIAANVREYFGTRSAAVDEDEAERFKVWLLGRVAEVTAADRIRLLKEVWKWGIKQGLVEVNPWQEIKIKIKPQPRPKPFSPEEVVRIIEAFRSGRYSYLADFVEFLFATGCRTGEAICLKWKHVLPDCSKAWIGESISRGVVGATKTNKARWVPLTASLQQRLLAKRSANPKPDDLVFPGHRGGYIWDTSFRIGPWKTVLEELKIPYRKPYTTRSTLITYAIENGLPPAVVAEIVGNSPNIIYKHYLGSISNQRLPDFFSSPAPDPDPET